MSRRNLIQSYRQEFHGYNAAKFRQDLLAGITVAAVALPLAFGVISGASAAAGLVTAIISGFLIGALSGAPYQISGPTGAMSAVLIVLAQKYGLNGVFVRNSRGGGAFELFLGRFAAARIQRAQCAADGAAADAGSGFFLHLLVQHGHGPFVAFIAVVARLAAQQFVDDAHHHALLLGRPTGVLRILHPLVLALIAALQKAFLQIVNGLAAEAGFVGDLLHALAVMQAEQRFGAFGVALIRG
jgi:MFS superfamily sulfate permease-like transporter